MGHCIDVYLIRKSELRKEKIDNIISDEDMNKIKWTEMKEGILATTHIPNIREFGKDKTIAKISTDYFGGHGYQSAKLFINNEKVYDESDEQNWKLKPINDVLSKMGITPKDGMDEFDTIGLGSYRSNSHFK